MKSDIERKEKQQASIIESQARRLEELEKLYKDEQVSRKRYFNMMEDMKGKIRVFCRVRPMLGFESDKGQTFALLVSGGQRACGKRFACRQRWRRSMRAVRSPPSYGGRLCWWP